MSLPSLPWLTDHEELPPSVLLRGDLNIPLEGTRIVNDHKLIALKPTLDYLLQQRCCITLISHLGRPGGMPQKNLSTALLLPWFKQHRYQVVFQTLKEYLRAPACAPITLLENLRFYPGEQASDQSFAQKLLDSHNFFVQDAFGSLHNHDSSITLLPKEFSKSHRCFGLLVQRELRALQKLRGHPEKPYLLLIGGNKLSTKLSMLTNIINAPLHARPAAILLGGALALPFLYAQHSPIGTYNPSTDELAAAHTIVAAAITQNVKLCLPVDVRYTMHNKKNGVACAAINQLPYDATIVDIGPETTEQFCALIAQAHTIFANGTMGIYTSPEYAHGTMATMQAIAQTNAFSVIGGGDAVAAAYQCGMASSFGFLSSGGGATLAYLAASDPLSLPGIKAML